MHSAHCPSASWSSGYSLWCQLELLEAFSFRLPGRHGCPRVRARDSVLAKLEALSQAWPEIPNLGK